MHDTYHSTFARIVDDTRKQTGYELPMHIEHYVVCLLAVHVDSTHFLPKHTFAHSLLNIQRSRDAKELGDTCLFVASVFPEYGVNERYYTDIGVTAYNSINTELFQTISVHFETVKTFTRYACRGASAVSTSLL